MRKICASLFALASLVTAAACALAAAGHKPVPVIAHVGLPFLAVLLAVTSWYLFRSAAAWQASLVCPVCRQPGALSLCPLGQPHARLPVLLLGGFLLMVLVQHAQPHRFRCGACAAVSKMRPVGSRLAVAWCLSTIFFGVWNQILAWHGAHAAAVLR